MKGTYEESHLTRQSQETVTQVDVLKPLTHLIYMSLQSNWELEGSVQI